MHCIINVKHVTLDRLSRKMKERKMTHIMPPNMTADFSRQVVQFIT